MPLLCNVLYLALLAMVAKWTSHRERQYYNPRTDSRQSSKARLCVYHVTAWQTRSCYCMANSNMYGKQYHATVWQTVSCYCMANSIMLLYGKQYHVTVWQTVSCYCMANSIMLLYGKQYHVTVWQTISCYCMVNKPQWPSLDCTVHGKQTSCLKLILWQLNVRTLRMWLCMKWCDIVVWCKHNALKWQQSHMAQSRNNQQWCKYTTSVDIKNTP